jgi:ankyrin repeat protein
MHHKILPIAILLLICGTSIHAMKLQTPNTQALWIRELSETKPNLATLRLLAEQGADVKEPGTATLIIQNGIEQLYEQHLIKAYAIIVAARQSDWSLVQLLLRKGANPNVTSEWPEDKHYTPLHFAVDKRAISAIEALIEAKANIDTAVGWCYWTPLRIVMQHRYNEHGHYVGLQEEDNKIITLLLRAGAQTYITDGSGCSDASYAQEHGIDLSALR